MTRSDTFPEKKLDVFLKYFEKKTGIGGILNTSFNIHGDPIVCSPEDAVKTLLKSGLKNLVIGDYYVRKQ